MKLVARFAAGALAVACGLFFGHRLLMIEASEPDDTTITQSMPDDGQKDRDADDSWADRDPPASMRFPTKAARVGISGDVENRNDQGLPSQVGRSIVHNLHDALSDFHQRFQFNFSSAEEFFGFGSTWGQPHGYVDRLRHRNLDRWYIVECWGNVLIEPRGILSGDDFQRVKIDLLSKASPFLRITKPAASRNAETLGNPEVDFERSIVTFDPLARLLEASNERATRTEWKIVRLQLIRLMKHPATGAANCHLRPTVGESPIVSTVTSNEFEQRAIEQLESTPTEKVVTTISDREIQVVGALRTNAHCQKCHQADDSPLLGVFSYRLKQVDPDSETSFPTSN